MIDRVMRRPEVLDALGVERERLEKIIHDKLLPRGFVIVPGGRAVGWMESWIKDYIEQRVAAGEAPKEKSTLPALSKRDTSSKTPSPKRPSKRRANRASRVEA